jgi:acyl carrier protein
MGLDLVEIVLETEDEFDVQLDHDKAPVVVGELYDVTLAALREQRPERFDADAAYADKVWDQFRAMICRQLGLEPEQVVKSAHFVTDLGCV